MSNAVVLSCLICGETQCYPALASNDYWIYRCAGCRFAFVAPTPTQAELDHYYDQQYAVPLERDASKPERHARRLDGLERWKRQRGRLLEIGSSYGHALAQARERGWQVTGVELSPTASVHARTTFGLDVWSSDVISAPFEPASFDAVMMWHVLEHTQNPRAQLLHLRSLLRPGGVLALRVPNLGGIGARLTGRSWMWVCPPTHLWYWTPATLSRMLHTLGFEVLEVATERGDGKNLYQHMLIALGGRVNALRRWFVQRLSTPSGAHAQLPSPSLPANPKAIAQGWITLLERAEPLTERLATWTRPLLQWLETHGGGDELIVYARRPLKEKL